jgi:pteridine reductase
MNLRDAVAVVTGGARRLGRAVAVALAREGCRLVVNHHRSEAETTLAELRALGCEAESFRADVGDAVEAEALIRHTSARFGRVDILVANAGVFRRTPLQSATLDDWNEMMRGNLDTFFYCAQQAAAAMRERGGVIIGLADVAAFRPWVDYAPYSASKSCVAQLVRSLAIDLAPRVRVNAIAPGPVLFPDGLDVEVRRREIDRTLLRRSGSPTDVAEAVTFLARADYVTGVVLPVDGGRLLFEPLG